MKDIKPGIRSYYSAEQVQLYLHRIGFPETGHDISAFRANLSNLELLVRLHLLAFPFENSRLHYSSNHEIDVSPSASYSRLVGERRGGSWCFGHNGLLLGILRGLGFHAYAAPARVNESPAGKVPEFTIAGHLVLLVQLDLKSEDSLSQHTRTNPDPTMFLVDVGFGGNGAVRPMLLEVEKIVPGCAPPEEHRLMRLGHPGSSLEEDELNREWVLQYRCGSHQPEWGTLFMFYEYEHFPDDWVATSQWLSRYPVEPFKSGVIVVAHFDVVGENGDAGTAGPLGRLVMSGKRIYRRVGDQSDIVKEFATERERVRILKDDFGIVVEEDELPNMLTTAAALPS